MVTIDCLSTSLIDVVQEAILFPSTSTVQARHCPSPQPYFVPVRCKSSRNTSSNERSGSVVRVWDWPFTVKVIFFSILQSRRRSAGLAKPTTSIRTKEGDLPMKKDSRCRESGIAIQKNAPALPERFETIGDWAKQLLLLRCRGSLAG